MMKANMLVYEGGWLSVVITAETLVAVLIVFLNGLVAITIVKPNNRDKFRTPTNILVANMAIADVLRGLICLPSRSAHHVGWPHDFIGCLVLVALENALHKVACMGFVFVTLERYVAICHPFRYPKLFSDKGVLWFCAAMWIVGSVIGLLPVIVWNGGWNPMNYCEPMMMYPMSAMVWWNAIGICTTFTIYVAVIYSVIAAVIVKHRRQIRDLNCAKSEDQRLKIEMRGTLRCFLIVSTFALTRLPLVVLNISSHFGGVECKPCRVAFDWLRVLQSVANPLLYAIGSAKLRLEMRRTVGCSGVVAQIVRNIQSVTKMI